MRNKFKHLKALFKFELDVSFPFPRIELLLIFLISLAIVGVYSQFRLVGIYLVPELDISQDSITEVLHKLEDIDIFHISAPLNALTLVLYGIIPLMVSFQIAHDFESNLFRRYISYPIGRIEIILIRIFIIWALTCGPSTLGIIIPYFLLGGGNNFIVFIILLVAFNISVIFVISVSVLIAIITRKSSYTALGGLSLTSLFLFVSYFITYQPAILRGILNPVYLSTAFFQGYAYIGVFVYEILPMDLLYGLLGSLLLGICMFLVSLVFVWRMDV